MSISIVSSSLEVRSFCRDLDPSIHTDTKAKKTAEVMQSGGWPVPVPTVILAHNRRMRALLLLVRNRLCSGRLVSEPKFEGRLLTICSL
jgi:hypothetical protein